MTTTTTTTVLLLLLLTVWLLLLLLLLYYYYWDKIRYNFIHPEVNSWLLLLLLTVWLLLLLLYYYYYYYYYCTTTATTHMNGVRTGGDVAYDHATAPPLGCVGVTGVDQESIVDLHQSTQQDREYSRPKDDTYMNALIYSTYERLCCRVYVRGKVWNTGQYCITLTHIFSLNCTFLLLIFCIYFVYIYF